MSSTEKVYRVIVGVAKERPLNHKAGGEPNDTGDGPSYEPDEYRKYIIVAESPLDARLKACWFSAHDSIMPVYASTPELIEGD